MIVTTRELNRATLERQLLSRRAGRGVAETLEHLAGMQAQSPFSPYVGLWTRLEDFTPDALAALLLDRSAVRTALMRGTVHLVTAADCLTLRPVLQRVLDRSLRANFGKRLDGLDLVAVARAGRELVEDKPRTNRELGALLGEQWPDRDRAALANVVRAALPLVQLPPRAVWGRSGQSVLTTAEQWLGRPLSESTAPDRMVTRYLAAFGPATVADAQKWSGLTRLREVVDRLPLRTLRGKDGEELFDVEHGSLPDRETEAPVRFLPEFDNLVVSYAAGDRVMSRQHRSRLMTANGIVRATVLVDGFVQGFWKIVKCRTRARLEIEPLTTFPRKVGQDIETEGQRLLAFIAGDTTTRDVVC